MNRQKFFSVYVLPAAVFQAVIFGGAYGTGREIVEFITRQGPVGGLLGLFVVGACFSLILFLTFEYARLFKVSDYQSFFRALIGPGWLVYEILFISLLVIVLAVNASAAGIVLGSAFGWNRWLGTFLLVLATIGLSYAGVTAVKRAMTVGSVILLCTLLAYILTLVAERPGAIGQALSTSSADSGWAASGLQYALYNLAGIPVLLYCARGIETRNEALGAGITAGLAGIFPAVVFHLTFITAYPEILLAELPVYTMVENLQLRTLLPAYVAVLYGMVILTAVGLLQGLNERVDHWLRVARGKTSSSLLHASVSGGFLALSLILASFGIIDLIAKGYGTMAWGFLVVYVLPLITKGAWQILRVH